MTEVSYAPRSQVAAWLRNGWRLISDHDYCPADWAVVMRYEPEAEPLSEAEIEGMADLFRREPLPSALSNIKRAARYRNISRGLRRHYDSRRLVQEMA